MNLGIHAWRGNEGIRQAEAFRELNIVQVRNVWNGWNDWNDWNGYGSQEYRR